MIVTIDGPAGAGKSSAARELAKTLGYRFLDTGAMYRAVTLAALRQNIDWRDSEAVAQIASRMILELTDDCILLDGEDVTNEIRSFAVTTLTHHAADNLAVREHLVALQQHLSHGNDIVSEGRDQATVVFPQAECKIFLTASDEVRAMRRFEDLRSRGEQITFEEVLEKQNQRDERDFQREHGGLRKAKDSIEVCTDGLTPREVVERLAELVRSKTPVNSDSADQTRAESEM